MSSETGQATGSLYRIDNGVASRMVTGITTSNGIAWNSTNTLMYYIDTNTNKVDVFNYDIETGNISNENDFIYLFLMNE